MDPVQDYQCPVCQTKMPFGTKVCPGCQTAIFYRNLSEDFWNDRKRKLFAQTGAVTTKRGKR